MILAKAFLSYEVWVSLILCSIGLLVILKHLKKKK